MILNALNPARLGIAVAITSVVAAAYGIVRRVRANGAAPERVRKAATQSSTRRSPTKKTATKAKRARTSQARA